MPDPGQELEAMVMAAAEALFKASPDVNCSETLAASPERAVYVSAARAAVEAALGAREEPHGEDALCEYGHTAHWHGTQGTGACEHDGDCDCEGFRVGLFSDTVICCDHGKVATAHCEMSGDGLVTLGELIESYSVHAESERSVLDILDRKWRQHEEPTSNMGRQIAEHGLAHTSLQDALSRSLGVERIEAAGEGWTLVNNDCIPELTTLADNFVDLIVTSIPFANHYQYTEAFEDLGFTEDNQHFWAQMDFLTPELLRVLSPGRIYACHVKDRILFGNVTGAGLPTSSPFHAEAIMHGLRHGFDYLGMVTVVTDVVRENNQTYRLGWSEQCKDGTKMGVGSPEYILLFHKPQTDRSKGYADEPVVKDKVEYSRSRWQVDAHAFWRSSGNRRLTTEELARMGPDKLAALFTEQSLQGVYDHEAHVRIGEELDARGALPSSFMALAPGSHDEMVWHDVNRMRTLNSEQRLRRVALHVCPLQVDIVDRLIRRYSNEGDLVLDPFSGLGTVPVRAMALGRQGYGVELNNSYFLDAIAYCQAQEREQSMPSLFDALEPA